MTDQSPPRVLVVDDSPTVRRMIEMILQRAGYEVYTVDSGPAGLEMAKVVQPMCVLTDFVMPGMHGHVFVQRLREESTLPEDLPVLLISSRAEEVRELFDELCGPVAVLTKPFEPDALLSAMEDLLEQAYGALNVPRPPEIEIDDTSAIEMLEALPTGGDSDAPAAPAAAPVPAAPAPAFTDVQLEEVLERTLARLLPPLIETRMTDALSGAGLLEAGDFCFAGSLEAVPLADVLNFAANCGLTGRVVLVGEHTLGEIHVDRGHFLHASVMAGDGHRLLGSLLLEQGASTLQPADLARALERAGAQDLRLGQALVEDGSIAPERLMEVLSQQAVAAFHELVEMPAGRFRLERRPVPAHLSEVGLRIPIVKLLMEAMRVLDEKRRATEAFPDEAVVLSRVIDRPEALEEFEINELELEHLERVDGQASLIELLEESHVSPSETKRIYHRLMAVGLLRPRRAA